MGIGKRKPWGKEKNTANSGDMKGRRLYVKATVNQVKRILGKLALKIRASADPGIVEIIHSDNRGNVHYLLRQAKLKIGTRSDSFAVHPRRRIRPSTTWH